MNISEVTREDFEPHLKKIFKVSAGESSFDAELIDVSPVGETVGPSGRAAFSLVWRGPQSAEPLQQTYRLENQEIGEIELFLVPIGPDDEGMKFEAVLT